LVSRSTERLAPQFRHPSKPGTVTIAGNLGNDLKPGTLASILRQAGVGSTMSDYLVVIEGSGDSYSAYAPDLPGCVAAGKSVDEVERLMREAIALHIESLRAQLGH
jgi:predicted RNase H-like HicB family nuclease